MEQTNSKPPRRIADTTECNCKCGKQLYRETIIGELQADETYSFHREVVGSFKQQTNSEGIPTGPVIPMCNCGGVNCPR